MRALPAATLFRWAFNNSVQSNQIVTNPPENNLQTKKNSEKSPYYHSTLKYQAKTEKDFGEVRCFASNELGESDAPCIFTLIPAGTFLQSSAVFKLLDILICRWIKPTNITYYKICQLLIVKQIFCTVHTFSSTTTSTIQFIGCIGFLSFICVIQ